MHTRQAILDLGLDSEELATVDRVFGAGRTHPWGDQLVDDFMDWIDHVALDYLKAKRAPDAITPFIPGFNALLDRIVLERFESLRLAAQDVHDNPPYNAADRWPRTEYSIVRTVVQWAFGNPAI